MNTHQKIYVVLDTNVIVAGLLSSKKDSATVLVLEYLFEKKFTLLLTQDILLEYQKVLSRSKFSFSKELITGFLSVIDKLAEKVTPVSSEIKLTDMNDLPFYEADREYVLDNLHKLVIKDVAEAGGYGVVFGSDMTAAELEGWRQRILAEPRRFIVQEVIDFVDLPVMDGDETVYRKADLRAFVLTGKDSVEVWPSGLTRFSRVADSFVVNSSQGGGFKDTWVKAS